jgi:hypothetical protein
MSLALPHEGLMRRASGGKVPRVSSVPHRSPALPAVLRPRPWLAGLAAARANLVPGLIVQAVMLSMLLSYYFFPPMQLALNSLAALKAHWSYAYSGLSSILAGAMIPELLRVCVFQNFRFHRQNATNLAFAAPFWCGMGVIVDFFYRNQALWFGMDATFPVVLRKVLVDQFLYNPLFAAPVTAMLYDWKNQGFSRHAIRGFFTPAYYRDVVIPTLFATWGVWIPIVAILYSLPSLLQIPLFGLALSLWVMIYTWMSEQRTPEMRC